MLTVAGVAGNPMSDPPIVGDWYRRPGGGLFEVVAIDEDDGTAEIQHFDGTVEEVELEAWGDQMFQATTPPEDWSGSVDMDPDLDSEESGLAPDGLSPLDYLDRAE